MKYMIQFVVALASVIGGLVVCERALAVKPCPTCKPRAATVAAKPKPDRVAQLEASVKQLQATVAKLEREVRQLHEVRIILEREVDIEAIELPAPKCDGECGDDCDCGGGCECHKAKKERKAKR